MALPQEKCYTFADIQAWDEDERIELVYGRLVMMATPLRIHQKVSGELFSQLHEYLKGKNVKFTTLPLPSVPLRRMVISQKMWIQW